MDLLTLKQLLLIANTQMPAKVFNNLLRLLKDISIFDNLQYKRRKLTNFYDSTFLSN